MRTAMKTRPALAITAILATAMVLVSALGLCLGGCSSKPTKPGQYTNTKDGFSITAPASWEKAEGKMGMTVVFVEPLAGASDTFRENVNVVVEKLPAGMGLDGYVKACNEALAKMMTNFKEVSSARVKLGENDAQRNVYQHKMGVYDLKVLGYFVVHGGRAYILTCTATVDEYDNHEPAFEDICKTFQTQ
jgi:serine/threonine-protein kinase